VTQRRPSEPPSSRWRFIAILQACETAAIGGSAWVGHTVLRLNDSPAPPGWDCIGLFVTVAVRYVLKAMDVYPIGVTRVLGAHAGSYLLRAEQLGHKVVGSHIEAQSFALKASRDYNGVALLGYFSAVANAAERSTRPLCLSSVTDLLDYVRWHWIDEIIVATSPSDRPGLLAFTEIASSSPGPLFFDEGAKAIRNFRIFKFRTMPTSNGPSWNRRSIGGVSWRRSPQCRRR
jgi:hypothetical protein